MAFLSYLRTSRFGTEEFPWSLVDWSLRTRIRDAGRDKGHPFYLCFKAGRTVSRPDDSNDS